MNTPEEIKVRILGEVVTVLDYGKGRFIAKAGGGNLDTEQGKIRHLAELQAVELLAAAYKRGPTVRANKERNKARATKSAAWKRAVAEWVDKKLGQIQYRKPPTASDLAGRLFKSTSDFKWPEGTKPVGEDEVRKVISAHLKAKQTP